MEILFCVVVAWLIVYRTTVGTWCAITGKQTPWEKSREARAARRGERINDPNRTARGFLGRLYGDMWEGLHAWLDESRARKLNGERRRTLNEWWRGVGDLARGLWPSKEDRDGDEEGQPETDLGPDYIGTTVRPPESAPTLATTRVEETDQDEAPEYVGTVVHPPTEAPALATVTAGTSPSRIVGELIDPDRQWHRCQYAGAQAGATIAELLRQQLYERDPDQVTRRHEAMDQVRADAVAAGQQQCPNRSSRTVGRFCDEHTPSALAAEFDSVLSPSTPEVIPNPAPAPEIDERTEAPRQASTSAPSRLPSAEDTELAGPPPAPLFPGVPTSVARSLPHVSTEPVNVFGGTPDDYQSRDGRTPDPLNDPGTAQAARIQAYHDAIDTALDEAATRREARAARETWGEVLDSTDSTISDELRKLENQQLGDREVINPIPANPHQPYDPTEDRFIAGLNTGGKPTRVVQIPENGGCAYPAKSLGLNPFTNIEECEPCGENTHGKEWCPKHEKKGAKSNALTVHTPKAAPRLSLVPPATTPDPGPASTGSAHQNSTTNGGTMTNPAPNSIEIATVSTLENFGQDVQSAVSGDWKQKTESARNAASSAQFTNDPEISQAISQMDEYLDGLASAGANLVAAMAKHKASEEALSGLGSSAASNTASYKRT